MSRIWELKIMYKENFKKLKRRGILKSWYMIWEENRKEKIQSVNKLNRVRTMLSCIYLLERQYLLANKIF